MTNEEFKKTLWDTANKLRGSVSAAEYKYPVLGMVFLKLDLPRSIDTSDPHDEAFSKASGLMPPRWLCRRVRL